MTKIGEGATPGPWTEYEGPDDKMELTIVHVDRSGQVVVIADCLQRELPPKERKANARLIVKALLLVEARNALFEALPYIEEGEQYNKPTRRHLSKQVRALLTKLEEE